ncbi:hypothetical protein [Isosphaera pallida]|uniref:hypothetical protein n=1 Tax=Isosphaera pallida TaxID=128 RepID=UPI0011D233F5|nr:hypothetical protein [Isosphaera pallida]
MKNDQVAVGESPPGRRGCRAIMTAPNAAAKTVPTKVPGLGGIVLLGVIHGRNTPRPAPTSPPLLLSRRNVTGLVMNSSSETSMIQVNEGLLRFEGRSSRRWKAHRGW